MNKRKTLLGLTLVLASVGAVVGSLLGFGIIDPGYQCGTESFERANKTHEVFEEYKDLFYRYPNRVNVNTEFLRDEDTGVRTETWGIVIIVDEKADEDTLPPERRIPDELEGVPVQIITTEIARKAEYFQRDAPFNDEPHSSLALDVREKNRDLFSRNPFFETIGYFTFERGSEPGNRVAHIEVIMSQEVHQLGLSPAVRIPDCLEDVPVKLVARSN